jgi:antitoxin component YwqK of YwqJK toxin-antitoxin module
MLDKKNYYLKFGFYLALIFLASCNTKKHELDDVMIRNLDSLVILKNTLEPISGKLIGVTSINNQLLGKLFFDDSDSHYGKKLNLTKFIDENTTKGTDVYTFTSEEFAYLYKLYEYTYNVRLQELWEFYVSPSSVSMTFLDFETSLKYNQKKINAILINNGHQTIDLLFHSELISYKYSNYILHSFSLNKIMSFDKFQSELFQNSEFRLNLLSIIFEVPENKYHRPFTYDLFLESIYDFSDKYLGYSMNISSSHLFEKGVRKEDQLKHDIYKKMFQRGKTQRSFDNFLFVSGLLFDTKMNKDTRDSINEKVFQSKPYIPSLQTDSLKFECTFKEGKLHGKVKMWYIDNTFEYWANGVLFLDEYYKNGLRHGQSNYWNAFNGNLFSQITFKHGKLDNEFKSWYRNGQLKCQTSFRNGNPYIKKEEYYKNGLKKIEVNYNRVGVLDGDYIIWNIKGERVVWKHYYNGIEEEYKYEEGNELGFEESYSEKKEKGEVDEIETFDKITKKYTNNLYGVGFDAPDNWIREEGSSKHSILKISHPDSVLMFVINVIEVEKGANKNNDINSWTNFDQQNKKMYQTLVQLGKGQLDTDIRNYKCEKEYLLNHKAIKYQYEITQKYPDFEFDVVKTMYQIQKGNINYNFGFDVPAVFYETNPEYYNSVFNYAFFIE